ncbi:MAG: zf-HC2 domain-containing protein [Streptosporangiaceae bacterium]
MTAMTGPACRQIRQLLGVYVVGAIDPAERAIVDDHLADCSACREELSGLAGLPALLGRVPREDVQRMDDGGFGMPDLREPSPELLNSLLRRVSVTRRTRRWRSVLALAAAVAIAAAGAGAAVHALHPAAPFHDMDSASNARLTATVNYSSTPWGGMAMQVGVAGIQPGALCQLYAHQDGKWVAVGEWTSAGSNYQKHWYNLTSRVPAPSVHGFKITSGGKTLIQIPA